MGLAAGIIMIFIIMVAFFVSFGKTFKVKNELINAVEQNEGMTLSQVQKFVQDKALVSSAYAGRRMGICYSRVESSKETGRKYLGFTMTVVVYMEMEASILGDAFNVSIPIAGETRLIEKGDLYNELAKKHGIDKIKLCDGTNYTKIQNS